MSGRGRWILRSTQEQAIAAWISQLNQQRLTELVTRLHAEGANLGAALGALEDYKQTALNFVAANRGGTKGVHGFIAEAVEVGIRNARSLVDGQTGLYELVNSNGPDDILRAGSPLQVKFCAAGFSLRAVQEHLEKYPRYVVNGGQYVVPKDFHDKILLLRDLTPEQASHLDPSTGATYNDYLRVQRFYEETSLSKLGHDIEPAAATYDGVQHNTFEKTLADEKKTLQETSEKRRNAAYQDSKPSLTQGAQATAIAAAGEGAMVFALGVRKKVKSGTPLREFTRDDWSELGGVAAVGTGKGAIRGASIYGLTNYTATPAAVASGLVTATFGIVSQARLLREGEIDQEDFLVNSQVVCLDAAVSAASSLIGQAIIPIPVVGAVVGNLVGTFAYSIAKEHLDTDEQRYIAEWAARHRAQDAALDADLRAHVDRLDREIARFGSISTLAFNRDINLAFHGSIDLARWAGVAEERILTSQADIDRYFLA